MQNREGFTEAEKKSMLLNVETSKGLKLTGVYILYVYMYMLHVHVYVLVFHSEVSLSSARYC